MEFSFNAELWEWQGQGAWCFISLPEDYFQTIRGLGSMPKRGFGSVKVEANIGKTVWKTSIFPDTKSKTYLLPVKKSVRTSENMNLGESRTVKIKILDV